MPHYLMDNMDFPKNYQKKCWVNPWNKWKKIVKYFFADTQNFLEFVHIKKFHRNSFEFAIFWNMKTQVLFHYSKNYSKIWNIVQEVFFIEEYIHWKCEECNMVYVLCTSMYLYRSLCRHFFVKTLYKCLLNTDHTEKVSCP